VLKKFVSQLLYLLVIPVIFNTMLAFVDGPPLILISLSKSGLDLAMFLAQWFGLSLQCCLVGSCGNF
jgi:hypothetical protein